jgi:hypothetical protein
MPLYTFFLQDKPEAVPRFELEWFDSKLDAKTHARSLLQERPQCSEVAVTEDDVEIDRLTRRSA